MWRLITVVGLFTIFSCSTTDQGKDEELAIVIVIANSYKYDLLHKTFTVFKERGDTTVNFHLSGQEKRQIADKYYRLELNELPAKVEIDDSCFRSPKTFTTLRVKSKGREQEIIIDDDCEKHSEAIHDTANPDC